MDLITKILLCTLVVILLVGVCKERKLNNIEKENDEKLKKLKDELRLVSADFDNIEIERIFADDSIRWLRKKLISNIQTLYKYYESNVSFDIDKVKHLQSIIDEDLNNIETVLQEELIKNIDVYKFNEKIEELVKTLSDAKISITTSISKDLPMVLTYDNDHFIASLRLILLKSIENGSKSINIVVNPIFKNKEICRLSIQIENINFLKKDSIVKMDDINTFFDLSTFQPARANSRIDAEFYIIRQNLLNITKNVVFSKNKNKYCINYEIQCKSHKSKLYLK